MQIKRKPWLLALQVNVLAIAAFSLPSPAQEKIDRPQTGDLIFTLYSEQGSDSNIQLINGVKAQKKDWPTIINALLDNSDDNSRTTCSAALVGPGVFITAAHCFDQGPGKPLRSQIWLNAGGQDIPAACTLADAYVQAVKNEVWSHTRPRVPEDFAICSFMLPQAVPVSLKNLAHEVVDVAAPLSTGDAVLMTGYGCSDPSILVAPDTTPLNLDGLLRIGDAKISSGVGFATSALGRFVEIRSSLTSAPALCNGDSGGPLISGATQAGPNGLRRIRGINSSIEFATIDGQKLAISRVAPLSSPAFVSLATQWLKSHKDGTICGLNGSAGFLPCRQ